MSTFREELDLAAAEILDPDCGPGEEITYHRSGSADRTLNVHVERFERDPDEGDMRAAAIVSLRDDADEGITSYTVGDEITLALRADDDTPTRYRIAGVADKTKFYWRLRVYE